MLPEHYITVKPFSLEEMKFEFGLLMVVLMALGTLIAFYACQAKKKKTLVIGAMLVIAPLAWLFILDRDMNDLMEQRQAAAIEQQLGFDDVTVDGDHFIAIDSSGNQVSGRLYEIEGYADYSYKLNSPVIVRPVDKMYGVEIQQVSKKAIPVPDPTN